MPPLPRRRVLQFGAAIAVTCLLSPPARADDAAVLSAKRVALRGYDPVSYFTSGQPEKGSADFASTFGDATYYFRNLEHLTMFNRAPDRYAPQYAGFCAGAIGVGVKVEADPNAWTISDGKLFVFFAKVDVPQSRDELTDVVAKADARWRKIHRPQ